MASVSKKLLCTIGPASWNQRTLCRLERLGVTLFRINLSHTRIEDLEDRIRLIRQFSQVPICLDTEGAQIRTGVLSAKEKFFKENEIVEIVEGIGADQSIAALPLYPSFVLGELAVGDLLTIDFDSVLIQIVSRVNKQIKARVVSPGWVGSNKAVNLLRSIDLPAITEKDKQAITIGMRLGINSFALSFANRKEDVALIRELTAGTAGSSRIIAKIESQEGYRNLDDILETADAILIDRGDLSREIPISLIPFFQRKIIAQANRTKKDVYVATNLLESMRENRNPTRAEVNDVINTLMMGADGLVLAAETAVGKWPIESATMVVRLMSQFDLSQKIDVTQQAALNAASMIVEPHGGQLVQRFNWHPDWDKITQLPILRVFPSVIMDAEQIGLGTYSPLTGFMTAEEVESVLEDNRLPGGVVWTLPIVLPEFLTNVERLKKGQEVALVNEADNEIYAVLKIKDISPFHFHKVAHAWFGTISEDHPGVARLKEAGDCFIGGEVTLLKRRPSAFRIYEFSPMELRHIFESKGWSRVVGFHTRNVVHRGHETIQRLALETTHADGLLISPVVGEKKNGDFTPKAILEGYQMTIDQGFLPANKAFIGALSTYSRYAGPREAVFTALCRKNFGCSHFIVGRDHTGVGNFYAPKAAQEFFESLGDIGITPVFFDTIYYCLSCKDYVFECSHAASQRQSISGTQVRNFLKEEKLPPAWLMRPEISAMIINQIQQKEEIFSG